MGAGHAIQNEYSIPVKSDEESKNCTPVHRNFNYPDKLIDNTDPPLRSVYDIFKYRFSKS